MGPKVKLSTVPLSLHTREAVYPDILLGLRYFIFFHNQVFKINAFTSMSLDIFFQLERASLAQTVLAAMQGSRIQGTAKIKALHLYFIGKEGSNIFLHGI